MTRIGLISDTHNFLDENIFLHFKDCDEVWHCGDFGNLDLVEKMRTGLQHARADKPGTIIRGVYGNIDGKDIRNLYPEKLHFTCEAINVFMQHIGGYPKRYAPGVKNEIIHHNVKLFISGHSHILKIIYDQELNCLHINPGAAGKQGWHTVRTIVTFIIDGEEIRDCKVVELGR